MSWVDDDEELDLVAHRMRNHARFVIYVIMQREASPPLRKYWFHRIEDCPGTTAKIIWGGPARCWEGNHGAAMNKVNTLKALHPDWTFHLEELEVYGLG